MDFPSLSEFVLVVGIFPGTRLLEHMFIHWSPWLSGSRLGLWAAGTGKSGPGPLGSSLPRLPSQASSPPSWPASAGSSPGTWVPGTLVLTAWKGLHVFHQVSEDLSARVTVTSPTNRLA